MVTSDCWDTVRSDFDSEIQGLVLEMSTAFPALESKAVSVGECMTVGRSKTCDLPVPMDRKMSRSHFSVYCESTHIVIRDLDSTNGTFVNGARVSERRIHNGDQISAGMTCFLVWLLRA